MSKEKGRCFLIAMILFNRLKKILRKRRAKRLKKWTRKGSNRYR